MLHKLFRSKKLCFIIVFLITAALIRGLFNFKISANIIDLIPDNFIEAEYFKTIINETEISDKIFVLFKTDSSLKKEFETELSNLAARLNEEEIILSVDYKITEKFKNEIKEYFLNYGAYYLNDKELADLKKRFSLEQNEFLRKTFLSLRMPLPEAAKQNILNDPLKVSGLFERQLNKLYSEINIYSDNEGGYYNKGYYYLLALTMAKPPQDIEFTRTAAPLVKNIINASPIIKYSSYDLAGGYSIALEDADIIAKDFIKTAVTSFLAVVFIFYFFTKSIRIVLYTALTLLTAFLWTLCLIGFYPGEINMVTAAFAAVLFGLGVDYTVHLAIAHNKTKDIKKTILYSGKSVAICAATTITAFFALIFTSFKGFAELGIIAGSGIFFCFMAAFLIFLPLTAHSGKIKTRKINLFLKIKNPAVLTALAVLFFLTLLISFNIKFDSNFRNLRPAFSRAFLTQDKIVEIFGQSVHHETLILKTETENLKDINGRLEKIKGINKIFNLGIFLPPPENFKKINNGLEDFDKKKYLNEFKLNMKRLKFKDDYVLDKAADYEKLLTRKEYPSLNDLTKIFGGRFSPLHYGGYLITKVYFDNSVYKNGRISLMKEEIEKKTGGVLTGINVLSEILKKIIINDFIKAVFIVALAVFLVLFAYFKKIKYVLYCFIPLCLTMPFLLSFMVLFNVPFNFINIAVLSLIVGIGIDYAVHIVNPYRQGHSFKFIMSTSGYAVLITTLTTMAGFASLIFSKYSGLKTTGYTAVAGIFFIFLFSIFILPAIISVFENKK